MTVKAERGGPRRNITSTKRSKDQNVYLIIQGDVPGGSVDKNVHYERIGGMGARKYPRESCCNRIECFATNSLAVLIRK